MMQEIGDKIRCERLARSMRQHDLAESVGVGAPHISKIESGREHPSNELLARMAAVLGRDPDELLLTARRMPADLLDAFAARPAEAIQMLRNRFLSES